MPAYPPDTDTIVITASLAPEEAERTPASVTVLDDERIERLDLPLLPSLLRLTPSAAVTVSGPAGSLSEIRLRGAESNHSLLFMDGIKVNDPASGDIPRFELLNADLASRIEIVRGPQSALWGSDAIGGVVAVNGLDDPRGWTASGEAGSFATRRASASGSIGSDTLAIGGAVGWQRARGIDSYGSPGGDKDGYRNLSGRLRATATVGPVRLGAAAIALTGRSEFDGYDLVTFLHQDTEDSSRNRLGAGRIWAAAGDSGSDWAGEISASYLSSSNRNFLSGDLVNRTSGTRRALSARAERRLVTGSVTHRLILAANSERETFEARDIIYGGFTDQDRDRDQVGLTGEWRATTDAVTADVAIRRDLFNRFRDATSLRAGLRVALGQGWSVRGGYAEGIAQPTFFDLYGFFPGSFAGNSALKPERSKGFEIGGEWRRGPWRAGVTAYRQRLGDEIVDVYDPDTFLLTSENRDGKSRRQGVEAEFAWTAGEPLRLSANYAYLDATEPAPVASQDRELRRPRHSGAIVADGRIGRFTYGASLAYVGSRRDRRDNFPYDIVRLSDYWLGDARIAYAPREGLELFVRGTNLLDQDYQETFGYRTEGRGLFAGIRLAGRRSSP